MPKSIITQNELLKEELVHNLLMNIPSIEKSVFDDIMRFIDTFGSDGGNFSNDILTADDLTQIEQTINKTLTTSGYRESVDLFMKDYGKITLNAIEIMDAGGYSFKRLPLSEIEKKWRKVTASTLLDSGIREDFMRPILKTLDDAISYGDSINTTRQKLSDFVLSGKDKSGKLKSYLTQTARDSISQMQGQQMNQIAKEIGYAGISYVGGLLKDSRGQCTHWVKDLNGFIPKEKLAAEIKLAYKNQAAKKITDGIHKWGGMMPNTTVDNFLIKRGGFNCTHTAIPKRTA